MLDGGGQHVPLFRLTREGAMDRGVIALRAAACENYFARIGIDQFGNTGARLLDNFSQIVPELIRARRITPILRQTRSHRPNYFGRTRRRRVVVEVINLLWAVQGVFVSYRLARTLTQRHEDAKAQGKE